MKYTLIILAIASCANLASAATVLTSPNVYSIDAGVTFNISNAGASNFVFSWTDSSGTFSNIADATFVLTAGETYSFQRTTGSHPFLITDDTLPVSGTDGSYVRGTTSSAVINAAALQPIADFTADPAPTSDVITWATNSSDIGDYYYTCTIAGHTGMTGAIQVVPEPSSALLAMIGLTSLAFVRRPSKS